MKRLYCVRFEVELYGVGEDENEAISAAEQGLRDQDTFDWDARLVAPDERLGDWADALPWGGDDDRTCADYQREVAEIAVAAERAKASPLQQVALDGTEGPTRQNAAILRAAGEEA